MYGPSTQKLASREDCGRQWGFDCNIIHNGFQPLIMYVLVKNKNNNNNNVTQKDSHKER